MWAIRGRGAQADHGGLPSSSTRVGGGQSDDDGADVYRGDGSTHSIWRLHWRSRSPCSVWGEFCGCLAGIGGCGDGVLMVRWRRILGRHLERREHEAALWGRLAWLRMLG